MTERDCSVFNWRGKPSIFASDPAFTWKKPGSKNNPAPKGPGIVLAGSPVRNGTANISTAALAPSVKTTRIRRGGVTE